MKNVLVVLALLATAACGEKKPLVTPAAPTSPSARSEAPTAPSVTSAPADREQMAVNVDDAIFKACNLKGAEVEASPKFDFDSDQLSDSEKKVLEQVAKCLTTGPLKGRAVELIGRADPRGEAEYNLGLGARRARAAHTFLSSLGVAGEKLFDTSRGALDASGTDESGWQRDRRVDLKLRAQ